MPAGLRIIEDFISEGEEQRLLQCVDWTSVDKNITTGDQLFLYGGEVVKIYIQNIVKLN